MNDEIISVISIVQCNVCQNPNYNHKFCETCEAKYCTDCNQNCPACSYLNKDEVKNIKIDINTCKICDRKAEYNCKECGGKICFSHANCLLYLTNNLSCICFFSDDICDKYFFSYIVKKNLISKVNENQELRFSFLGRLSKCLIWILFIILSFLDIPCLVCNIIVILFMIFYIFLFLIILVCVYPCYRIKNDHYVCDLCFNNEEGSTSRFSGAE